VIVWPKAGWNLDQLRVRAYDSWRNTAASILRLSKRLTSLPDYVDGDYQDPATFAALRKEPQGPHRPAHYLAIRLFCFETVVKQLAESIAPKVRGSSSKNLRA